MENRKEIIIAGVGTLVAIISLILFLRRGAGTGNAGTVISSPNAGLGDLGAGGSLSVPPFDPTGGIHVDQPSGPNPVSPNVPNGPANAVIPDSTPVQPAYA